MRFATLEPERMSPEQKCAYDAIVSGPRGGARGPFNVLLRSPELADRVQRVGEYLRFKSSLPARLNEFAILINARFWESKYEWYAHRPLAVKGGLAESITDDLARNRRPARMKPDEELVYEFCTSLHRTHAVPGAVVRACESGAGRAGRRRPDRRQRLLHARVHGAERGRDPAAGRRGVALVRRDTST
jgi:4-carboxymuconolactone decarboxylase